MSKFATMTALILVMGYAAFCLITYPATDQRFILAAYGSGAVAASLVLCEWVRLIFRGVFDGIQWMHNRKIARQNAKANRTLQTPLSDSPTA